MNELAKYLACAACASLVVLSSATGMLPQPVSADTYFDQTGANMWGPFEIYWKAHGGLAQFGMARTNVFPTKDGYDAQWFERAMFTYDPNNPDPYKVQLQLLGAMATANRRGEAPFRRAQQMLGGSVENEYYPVTGHNLNGKLLDYWRSTGGLAVYGYPISEQFTEKSKSNGKNYTVQYFERNRLELHPEAAGTPFEVQLGLLGSELLDAQGGPAAFANLGRPINYPPPTKSDAIVPPGGVVVSPGAGSTDPGTTMNIPDAPALPPATSDILFQSDFSKPDLSAWQPLASLGAPGERPAAWQVISGTLQEISSAAADSTAEDAILATQDRTFRDYTLDAYYFGSSGNPIGAVLRLTESDFYLLKLYPEGAAGSSTKAVLYKASGGQLAQLATTPAWGGYKVNTWQRLTITADKGNFDVKVDGQAVLQAHDTSFDVGAIGSLHHSGRQRPLR